MGSDRDLGLAVIGAGYWGKNVVRNFDRVRGARLVGVADLVERNLDRARAAHPTVDCQSDYRVLLDRSDIDAVAICTGAASHYAVAKDALLAGKDVYVEKPLTLEVPHAEELVQLAASEGRILMVGHLLLYHPCIQWIHSQIESGDVGDLYYMYCQRLNLGIVRQDESAWWSLAPHDISIILHFFGALPTSVSARGNSYIRDGIEDVVFANLQFATGQTAEVHTSWLDPHKVRSLTLVGNRRMVTFDDVAPREKLRVYDKGADRQPGYANYAELISMREGDIWIPSIQMTEPLLIECQHFVDSVRDRTEPLTPGQQGLDVVRVLCAGQESIALDGAPVSLG